MYYVGYFAAMYILDQRARQAAEAEATAAGGDDPSTPTKSTSCGEARAADAAAKEDRPAESA